MNPTVFQFSVSDDGRAEPGLGVLAAYIPANAGFTPLVLAGCDPRNDPGRPIEGLAGPVFLEINRMVGCPEDLRWAVVDNWGRFFEAIPRWSTDKTTSLLEFKRFPGGLGVDAFTKELGATGEAALELLSSIIEGQTVDALPASANHFLEAIESHGNLPSPGALFQAVNAAVVTDDLNAAVQAIKSDPVITATLVNYANAAAFANAGRTASVSEAVQRLGLNKLRRVVFIAEMMARYKSGACPDFDYRAYWRNAVATGAAMRGLMAKFTIPASFGDDCFTAGLLAGIGWLAVAETFPALMSDYLDKASGLDPLTKARLQKSTFPASIAQVTETYLSRFDFPETVHSAITGAPTQDGWAWFDCLAAAIRVGQSLAPLECLAIPTNIPVPELCQEEWQSWQSLLAVSS